MAEKNHQIDRESRKFRGKGSPTTQGTRQIHGILHAKEFSTADAIQVLPEIGIRSTTYAEAA